MPTIRQAIYYVVVSLMCLGEERGKESIGASSLGCDLGSLFSGECPYWGLILFLNSKMLYDGEKNV